MGDAADACLLHGARFVGFRWADQKAAEQVAHGGWSRILLLIRFGYACFEPVHDIRPGPVVGGVLMVSTDVPDTKLTVTAVKVGTSRNGDAGILCLRGQKGGSG